MVGIACIHVAMGWIGGVLYSRVARTCSYFRGSESRLIYVGRGPAYVVWSGIPSWVFRTCLAWLLLRSSSKGAGAILEEPQIVAPPKRLQLLCFLLKNGFFIKTFGRAPLEEPEPEPERSPAKQVKE